MKSISSKAESELDLAAMEAECDSITGSYLNTWLRGRGLQSGNFPAKIDLVNVSAPTVANRFSSY